MEQVEWGNHIPGTTLAGNNGPGSLALGLRPQAGMQQLCRGNCNGAATKQPHPRKVGSRTSTPMLGKQKGMNVPRQPQQGNVNFRYIMRQLHPRKFDARTARTSTPPPGKVLTILVQSQWVNTGQPHPRTIGSKTSTPTLSKDHGGIAMRQAQRGDEDRMSSASH